MTADAQGADASRTHAGTLSVKPDKESGKRIADASQRAAAFAAAQRVLDVLRRDPALASPVGFDVVLRRLASARLPGDAPAMAYHAAVLGSLDYYATESDGRGGQRLSRDGGSVPFHVALNDVGSAADIESTDAEADGGPRVMLDLKKTGEFRGRPVYNGACTYISRRPAPPVIPLTQERYLNLELLKAKGEASRHEGQRQASTTTPTNDALERFLRERPQRDAQNRQTVDAMQKAGADAATIRTVTDAFRDAEKQQEAALRGASAGGADQNYQDILQRAREGEGAKVAQIQAQLDGLSPAQRKAPAYLIDHGRGMYTLGSADDPDVILAMQPNPAFYDASLSPAIPQVLWICLPGLHGVADSSDERLAGDSREEEKRTSELRAADAVRIRDKLDWAALEALVKP
jgi:hypothetical protein